MVIRTSKNKMVGKCPVCDKVLKISILKYRRYLPRHGFKVGQSGGCSGSGLILGAEIEPNIFQGLTVEQANFFDPKSMVTE